MTELTNAVMQQVVEVLVNADQAMTNLIQENAALNETVTALHDQLAAAQAVTVVADAVPAYPDLTDDLNRAVARGDQLAAQLSDATDKLTEVTAKLDQIRALAA